MIENQVSKRNFKKNLRERAKVSIVFVLILFFISFLSLVIDYNSYNYTNIAVQISTYLLIITFSFFYFFIPYEFFNSSLAFKYKKLNYPVLLISAMLSFIPILSYYIYLQNLKGLDHGVYTYLVYSYIMICYVYGLVLISYSLQIKKVDFKLFFWQIFLFTFIVIYSFAFIYVTFVNGFSSLIIIFLIPILSDTFAYIFGNIFGKNKMCPKISPKKTWEGFIISLFLTTLLISSIIVIYYYADTTNLNYFNRWLSIDLSNPDINVRFVGSILMILFLILVSTFGDLAFSYFKRLNNIKDFSNLLKGHGGIIDRLDSSIFVVSFYFILTWSF
jgi:phosphatidate cytidylyltransferase